MMYWIFMKKERYFFIFYFCPLSNIFYDLTVTLMILMKRKHLHLVLMPWHCGKRSKNLMHSYAVAAWAFSIQPEIHSHAINWLMGCQHLQIEQVVIKLHKKPYPNLNMINKSIEDIVDIFRTECKNFQSNRYPFDCSGWFATKDAITGCSHIWHEMYSLPYT